MYGTCPQLAVDVFHACRLPGFLEILPKFFLSLPKAIAQVWANYKKFFFLGTGTLSFENDVDLPLHHPEASKCSRQFFGTDV